MTLKKIEEYGDFVLSYDEEESEFVATSKEKTGTTLRADKLKNLKEKIDRLDDEPKITQPKQDAIMLKSGGYGAEHNFSFSELTVGAFGMKKRWSGSSAKELFVWITTKGKSRYSNRRERIEVDRYACIYKDTPEAREIAKKVLKISEKVDKFVKEKVAEQKALIADLTPIEPAIDAEKLPEWEQ